jgi:hypothetical protein
VDWIILAQNRVHVLYLVNMIMTEVYCLRGCGIMWKGADVSEDPAASIFTLPPQRRSQEESLKGWHLSTRLDEGITKTTVISILSATEILHVTVMRLRAAL